MSEARETSLGDRDIDVLVVGEINPDIVDLGPRSGAAVRRDRAGRRLVTMTVGSSSAIFACGTARLGLRTAFVGVVGDDAFGRFMLDAMAGRGSRRLGVHRRPGASRPGRR